MTLRFYIPACILLRSLSFLTHLPVRVLLSPILLHSCCLFKPQLFCLEITCAVDNIICQNEEMTMALCFLVLKLNQILVPCSCCVLGSLTLCLPPTICSQCQAWVVLLLKRDSPNYPYMFIYYSPWAVLFLSFYSSSGRTLTKLFASKGKKNSFIRSVHA